MDPVYNEFFDILYRLWGARVRPNQSRTIAESSASPDEAAGAVRRTVDDADRKLSSDTGLRLRSDARYFLLLNLTEMIVRPIQMQLESPPFAQPSTDLDRMIRADVNLIVSDAARRHLEGQRPSLIERPSDNEISGHLVVDALAANWTRLKLSSYSIWG